MIIGIGIDIIELNRIEKMLDGKLKFMERILTENERNVAMELKGSRLTEFVAGRFAAKEAYSKAVGTGIGKEVSFLDIEVMIEGSRFLLQVQNILFIYQLVIVRNLLLLKLF